MNYEIMKHGFKSVFKTRPERASALKNPGLRNPEGEERVEVSAGEAGRILSDFLRIFSDQTFRLFP